MTKYKRSPPRVCGRGDIIGHDCDFSLDTVFLMPCILCTPSHLTINLALNKSSFMKVL